MHSLVIAPTNAIFNQAARYLVVGVIATVADVASLWVLTEFAGFPYPLSAALGFVLGVAVNYLLSVRWVFASRTMDSRTLEFTVFVVIGIVGLGLTELVMFLGVGRAHLHYLIVKLMAVVIVFAWNFGVRRALLFR